MMLMIVFTLFSINYIQVSNGDDENMSRLIEHLYKDRNPYHRPVEQEEDTVFAKFDMALHVLLKVDERNEILKASYWIRMYWIDESLTWNETEFGGINKVFLDSRLIWKPDIYLINDVTRQFKDIDETFLSAVLSTGHVTYAYPAPLESTCSMNLKYFPWDNQTCEMQWSSESYSGKQVRLEPAYDQGDTGYYHEHGQWVVGYFGVRTRYDTQMGNRTILVYYLNLLRKPNHYMIMIVMPCILITFCGLLGVFVLPNDCNEKVNLAINELVACSFFLIIILETMPTTSEVIPLIAVYFQVTIILLVWSLTTTLIIIEVHYHGTLGRPLPWIAQIIFLRYVAKVTHMYQLCKVQLGAEWEQALTQFSLWQLTTTRSRKKMDIKSKINDLIQTVNEVKRVQTLQILDAKQANASSAPSKLQFPQPDSLSEIDLDPQISYVEDSISKLDWYDPTGDEDEADHPGDLISEAERCRREWVLLAIILDRVAFVTFLIIATVTTYIVLVYHQQAPHHDVIKANRTKNEDIF